MSTTDRLALRGHHGAIAFAILLVLTASATANERTEAPELASRLDALLSPEASIAHSEGADPQLLRFEELRGELRSRRAEARALEADAMSAYSIDALALRDEASEIRLSTASLVREMADAILDLESREIGVKLYRQQIESFVPWTFRSIRQLYHVTQGTSRDLQKRSSGATGTEAIEFERRTRNLEAQTARLLSVGIELADVLERLGGDPSEAKSWLRERVASRARLLNSRIDLATAQLGSAEARLAAFPEDADAMTVAVVASGRFQQSADALATTIEQMNGLGMDATRFHRTLIESTGEITSDVFDRGIARGILSRWMSGASDAIAENGPGFVFKALLFIFVILLFWTLSRFVRNVTARAVEARHLRFSQLLKRMIVSFASGSVMMLGALIALSQLGVEIGPMLAGVGILGFIAGFALQDALGNFAAGVMILAYRPFDVGDLIECCGSVFGTVSHMNIVSTTILTLDNQTRVVPNGKIWGDVITNVAAQRVRRVDMMFGISYDDEIPRAEEILHAILEEHPKVVKEPEPMVKVHELGDSSVNFVVRPWCSRDDYWDVHWDVTREVKLRFDREGITIPYPQRDVHMPRENARATTDEAMEVGDSPSSAGTDLDGDD